MRTTNRRVVLGVLAWIGTLALFGCDQVVVEPTPGLANLALVADLSDVSVGDTVEVEILVSDVEDLYGVALDVVYPAEVFSFYSCVEGEVLGRDGLETNQAFALESGEEGRLVVGLSRLGLVDGIDGSGRVAVCHFEVAREVNGATLFLDKATLFDSHIGPIVHEKEGPNACS